jgi:ectoine hydroxylase-related dioxygenase (phytanoyl-CoA dioxygenase family)
MHPEVLAPMRAALGSWCDFPEINLTQGLEVHPGAPAQIPHTDQAMWPFLPKGAMELCVNVFWPFVPFTEENGATRIWPDTHHRPRVPDAPLDEPVVCRMEPGDALIVLGSAVHGAGANRSARPRRAAIVSYCLGWLKAYENQSLAYSADFAATLEPELAAMLGYRWHRPNLGTYDGQCPSVLLGRDVPDHLATVDALSADHAQLVARFAARQRTDAPQGAI